MLIVFIGADGSGKTSIAKAVAKNLKNNFSEVKYFHTEFGIVPRIGIRSKIKKFFFYRSEEVTINHEERQKVGYYDYPEPHSIIMSILILLHVAVDYLCGYFVVNSFKKNKKLMIFDRYFYEYFTEENFLNQPFWLFKLCEIIFPKPNLVIFLFNDPEIIFKRKSEQSIKQIRDVNKRNKKIIKELSYGITIKTDDSIEQIALDITKRILRTKEMLS